jgi:hypothetical protein
MVAACSIYFAFGLMVIINESLELGMQNLAWRWVIKISAYLMSNFVCTLVNEDMVVVQNFEVKLDILNIDKMIMNNK